MTVALKEIKGAACRLRETGFFNIVGAGVLNKIVSFASGVILIRVLSKGDYGAYSYALNIINYFVLFNGLGTSACVVQLCVERGEAGGRAEIAYQAASAMGVMWDIALTIAIVAAAIFLPLPVEGANVLLLFLAPFPIFSLIMDFQLQRLRSMFMNGEYALATNMNTLSLALFSVGGAVFGSSAGLSMGRSIAMAVSSLVARLAYQVKVYARPPRVEHVVIFDILKMSITVCLTNAIAQLLILIGTTLVGYLTGDQVAVASYAAAATIPIALMFLPSMVVTYVTPYFIQNVHNRVWVLQKWIVCMMGVGVVVSFASVTCIAGSSWIIPFVFGEQYISSIPSFQVLMVAFAVGSTFRTVSGNILAAHRRYGFNFVSNIVSLIVALVSTGVLVPLLGIVGAAVGYMIAMLIGSVFSIIGIVLFAGKPLVPGILDSI